MHLIHQLCIRRGQRHFIKMQKLIIFSAMLALAAAAPAYLTPEFHVSLGKTTVTKSSQVVDHGSTYVHHPVSVIHAPVVHAPVVHAPLVHTPVVHVSVPAKSTVTKSSQVVDHGSSTLVHAPVVHTPVYHAGPVVHSAHVVHASVESPVYIHSSPLVTFKSGDSAISHLSSTVHETVPFVAVHH